MYEDEEGFLYPVVDIKTCTDCGLCEKVCPVINYKVGKKPNLVYAAKSHDEQIRMESSSGGVFTLLAEQIIKDGGIVFGARFNENWEVIHDYTETIEGLSAFRGSKYVQSRIGKTYSQAKQFLKAGRKVLFSGTPCQIAGLKLFLRKEYDKLLTVDFVCHGVPSPMIWIKYLSYLADNQSLAMWIENINFRSKTNGWKNYNFVLYPKNSEQKFVEPLHKNLFMKGFLSDLYLRPSCHRCPTKSLSSGSDITLGDFWGIQNVLPNFDDDKGVSLVMINSEKGKSAFNSIDVVRQETAYKSAVQYNPAIEISMKPSEKRSEFFRFLSNENLNSLILRLTHQTFAKRILRKIGRLIKRTMRVCLKK
jgi:coenzyme F420-reducing hydrogenase beta subunit